ncbi:MAG: tellurite resistance TerB family protein [Pseudomonadota bacterium]
MLSPQAALIYAMVVAAESDHEIAEEEINIIGDLVNHLPVFAGTSRHQVTELAMACSEALAEVGGADRIYGMIREALNPHLREAAYALSCDVIAVDCRLQRDEMQVLEQIRQQLDVDRATAATIERAAQVRFRAA